VKKYLNEPIKMQEEIFKDIFEILLEEIELYRIFIMDPGLSGYLNKLKTTIKSKMQSEYIKTDKHKIAFEFTFEGTYGTIIEWIKNDYTNKETLALELSHIYNNIWLYVYNNEDLITVMKSFKEK
jgi:hypothetical protein